MLRLRIPFVTIWVGVESSTRLNKQRCVVTCVVTNKRKIAILWRLVQCGNINKANSLRFFVASGRRSSGQAPVSVSVLCSRKNKPCVAKKTMMNNMVSEGG